MVKNPEPGSGVNILDNFSESFETVFGLKILKFFDADTDPGSSDLDSGSGMKKFGSGIRYKHPGSARLVRANGMEMSRIKLYGLRSLL
jgi:hypothetical protein